MIAKVNKGAGFRGALEYAMEEGKGYLIDSNIPNCSAAKDYARKLASNNDLNSRVTKPVFHAAISIEKGVHLTDETFKSIGNDFIKMYGFNKEGRGEIPFVMIKHTNTEHEHIHIIANRIDSKGYCYNPSNDYKLINKVCRDLEKIYGLKVVKSTQNNVKETPRNEIIMRERLENNGVSFPNHRKDLRNKIDVALSPFGGGKRPFKSFVNELQKQGVDLVVNVSQGTGRINGVSYGFKDEKGEHILYKGSALGKGYSFSGLVKQLDYVPERDNKLIRELAQDKNEIIQSKENKVYISSPNDFDNKNDSVIPNSTSKVEADKSTDQVIESADHLLSSKGTNSGSGYKEELPNKKKRFKRGNSL
jgi:hypothetical protein